MRRLVLPLLLLAACSEDPLRRIPATDRALLEAEARLGGGTGQPGERTTVADLLARARGDAADRGGLVLRFAGDAVQPDASQRARLAAFAAQNRTMPLVVTGGRGDPALLGERRAVAVARALEGAVPGVELRFASGAPADVVQIASGAGTPLAPAGGP